MANVIGQYQSCSKTPTDKNSKTNSKTYVDEIAQEKVSNTSSLGKTIGNPKLSDKALEYYLLALNIWLKKDARHPNAKVIFGNLYGCYEASKKEMPFEEWLIKQLKP